MYEYIYLCICIASIYPKHSRVFCSSILYLLLNYIGTTRAFKHILNALRHDNRPGRHAEFSDTTVEGRLAVFRSKHLKSVGEAGRERKCARREIVIKKEPFVK